MKLSATAKAIGHQRIEPLSLGGPNALGFPDPYGERIMLPTEAVGVPPQLLVLLVEIAMLAGRNAGPLKERRKGEQDECKG